MFFAMLAAMDGSVAAADPVVSNVAVATNNAGACFAGTVDTEAIIDVTWSVANSNATLYRARLYENDILVSTQDSDASMSWQKTITGAVENGPNGQWNADWTYRVDIERKSDSQVMSSASSSQWTQLYGSC